MEIACTNLDIDLRLQWHFQENHYPPLPLSLIPVAKRAIQNCNNGDWDKKVRLPDLVEWKGKKLAPSDACVEAWHLDFFLDSEVLEYCE